MQKVRKILFYGFILFIGGLVAFSTAPYILRFLYSSGFLAEEIMIAGTGSMYPTFPKGEGSTDIMRAQEVVAWPKMKRFPAGINIAGVNLFSYKLSHGDIVDIENEKTSQISQAKYGEPAGFVKRIIATSGDTISLRDGFVILNGQLLLEPYTAKARSTFGGELLPDCQELKIPDGKVFVMGDNRKASLDSRFELGLADEADIRYILPDKEQEEWKKSYRDTSADFSLTQTATLNEQEFVKLLNVKRKEKNLKPYKLDKLLSLSAKRRGNVMIATDDFSTEATRSSVTLRKAVAEVGYRNIVFAEVFSRGYFEADELLENFLEFPQTKNILFSSDYQDIGISPVLGEVNNCPTQVVIVHLGGYVPPDYKKEDLESWQKLADNLIEVLPTWEAARGTPNMDEKKLEQLIIVLRERKDIAAAVLSRIKANEWLTDAEKNMLEKDKKLAEEADNLVVELNKQ